MIHVGRKLHEVCDLLEKEGFNEIYCDIEKESIWNREYGIVLFDWLFYELDYDSPYLTFDHDSFRHDFLEFLGEQFPGCLITTHMDGDEIEISGPNYDKYYEKIKDKLEGLEYDDLEGGTILEDVKLEEKK